MSPKVRTTQAKATRLSAKTQADRRREQRLAQLYRRHRLLVRSGVVLMVVGVLLALQHAAAHLGAFGPSQPPLFIDMVAGWPLAALLFLAGVVLAGRRSPL